jgi:hypothetical protein
MLTPYLLIFVLQSSNAVGGAYPITAGAIEFNSAAACQAAAGELRNQMRAGGSINALICAKKG